MTVEQGTNYLVGTDHAAERIADMLLLTPVLGFGSGVAILGRGGAVRRS